MDTKTIQVEFTFVELPDGVYVYCYTLKAGLTEKLLYSGAIRAGDDGSTEMSILDELRQVAK